jgi:hypothetical protein
MPCQVKGPQSASNTIQEWMCVCQKTEPPWLWWSSSSLFTLQKTLAFPFWRTNPWVKSGRFSETEQCHSGEDHGIPVVRLSFDVCFRFWAVLCHTTSDAPAVHFLSVFYILHECQTTAVTPWWHGGSGHFGCEGFPDGSSFAMGRSSRELVHSGLSFRRARRTVHAACLGSTGLKRWQFELRKLVEQIWVNPLVRYG